MKIICMIPARLGSQRLAKKNLQLFNGETLIKNAINKAKSCTLFDEIWVNSEAETIGEVAKQEHVNFHLRPARLSTSSATSEDFVYEFLNHHECDFLIQLHSIAPLISNDEIHRFTKHMMKNKCDVLLSVEQIQIECLYNKLPINFNFNKKTNSQDLVPIERISWAITGWRRSSYLDAYLKGKCATYAGVTDTFPVSKNANLVIKTMEDLQMTQSIFDAKR